VWKATYKTKVVAAKQLYGGATADSSQLEELAAEVGVLAQLSHCNIVRFLGLCRHHDESEASSSAYLPLFIVQEYCPTNLRAAFSDTFSPQCHVTNGHWKCEELVWRLLEP